MNRRRDKFEAKLIELEVFLGSLIACLLVGVYLEKI